MSKTKTLIVAEKPSVGRDIAGALPGTFEKHDAYLESDEYVITWAIGHLVELAEPEDYDPKFKKWKRGDLPIIPDTFRTKPRDGGSSQLKVIHKLVNRPDVDKVVNACDAGREGELIFAYTMENAPKQKPVQRLWISSMTKRAIVDGFAQLREGDSMRHLEAAARSRSEADWLVGMNATRASTIQARSVFGGVVSMGRVQTPTLGILAAREAEIQAFEPETYFLVQGAFKVDAERSYVGTWFDPASKESDALASRIQGGKVEQTQAAARTRAHDIVSRVANATGVIEQVDKKKQTERAPLLYDLTSLQRDANRRFGYGAKRTLSLAQSLYEQHKVLTYPRTNSRYLTTDMVDELKPRARMLGVHSIYEKAADYVVSLDKLPLERIVNDEKVDDHHAIIPTEQTAALSKLRDDERRIYDLVVRRFLAVFHPTARFELTTLVTLVAGERFRTKGRVMVEAGWKAVYEDTAAKTEEDALAAEETKDDDEKEQRLPAVEQGEPATCTKAEAEEKQTKPPARYTEGTLLSAMETAGKLVDDEALREAMKERGLGTPATRAQIIDLLANRQYIQHEGRNLRVTAKGMKLVEMLEGHPLTSPEMTGDWEKQLRDIEHGQVDRSKFMKGIVDFTRSTVEQILAIDREKLRMQRAELGPCPRCAAQGREEIIRENSRAFGCTSWKSKEETGCGFVIWRTIAGRQLMPEEAKELIENRETAQELQGFRSKAGKPFRAKLKLNDEDKVEFIFAERKGGNRGKPGAPGSNGADEAEKAPAAVESEPAAEPATAPS